MNATSFSDPQFKSNVGVIKHVEDEISELMKMNVSVTAANVDSVDHCEVVEISDIEDSSLAVEAPPKKIEVHPLK